MIFRYSSGHDPRRHQKHQATPSRDDRAEARGDGGLRPAYAWGPVCGRLARWSVEEQTAVKGGSLSYVRHMVFQGIKYREFAAYAADLSE